MISRLGRRHDPPRQLRQIYILAALIMREAQSKLSRGTMNYLGGFFQPKLWYLGLEEGMIHLDKLRQIYILAALIMREAQSKLRRGTMMLPNYKIINYKIGDLVMIKNFDKKSTLDAKYIHNYRVMWLIGARQLVVSNLIVRARKVNVCDAHKTVPSNHIISSIPDEQVLIKEANLYMTLG